MEIPTGVAELLRDGLSNREVSRRTGIHPVKVGEARQALKLPSYYGMLPVYVAPDSHRDHGTRAKYFMEKCRCRPCRDANRTAENERSRLLAYGRYEPPFVDAEPVRAHLRYLRSCGMGLRAIAAISGIQRKNLQSILNGRPDRGSGPQKGITPARAAVLLAIEPTLDSLSDGAVISGTGTTRRLQALVAMGWPVQQLAEQMGWRPSNLRVLITAAAVTVKTARLVLPVYERLWRADPLAYGASPDGVTHAKDRAERERWAPVGAWDDDTIDDPAAFPDWTGQCGSRNGYAAHYKHGIPMCPPCREANLAYRRALSQRQTPFPASA